jgi:uncharacterized protein
MTKLFATALLALLALSGCAGVEPTRFYLLTPEAKPARAIGDLKESNVAVVVGPIRLPEYLKRSQIVTRFSDNELELGWHDRWAEPLDRNFSRILGQNIEQLLSCRCVSSPAPKLPPGITYRVEIDVAGMDGVLGQRAILDVYWSVYTPEKKLLLTRKSSFVQPIKERGYGPFVQAQSKVLFDFSLEIATAIAMLQKEQTAGNDQTAKGR